MRAQQFINDQELAETVMQEDNKLKILYFTASWCRPCKYMKPIIKSIDENRDLDVTIYKMDIDENNTDDILGVNSVPTFIYLKNGIKMGQSKGAKREAVLEKMIRKYSDEKAEGNKLKYAPVPSKLSPVAGAHPKLTLKNIKEVWHDKENLTVLSNNILKNLADKQDIQCALILAQRAREIKPTSHIYAIIAEAQLKLGSKSKAKKAIETAIRLDMIEGAGRAALYKSFLETL